MYDELINDLLNEAADLLDESAGKNGLLGRYAHERYKSEKARNDAQDAKYERYKRLGYGDKIGKADRYVEEKLKDVYDDDDQNHKRFTGWEDPKDPGRIEILRKYIKEGNKLVKRDNDIRTDIYNLNNPGNRIVRKELSDKQKALHNKINKRAGINESVDALDLYDIELLQESIEYETLFQETQNDINSLASICESVIFDMLLESGSEDDKSPEAEAKKASRIAIVRKALSNMFNKIIRFIKRVLMRIKEKISNDSYYILKDVSFYEPHRFINEGMYKALAIIKNGSQEEIDNLVQSFEFKESDLVTYYESDLKIDLSKIQKKIDKVQTFVEKAQLFAMKNPDKQAVITKLLNYLTAIIGEYNKVLNVCVKVEHVKAKQVKNVPGEEKEENWYEKAKNGGDVVEVDI